MTAYGKMTAAERGAEYARVQAEFEELKARGLKLNMARGKPSKVQVDLINDMFQLMQDPQDYISDGIDVRNEGEPVEISVCGERRLLLGSASAVSNESNQ